jgi:hypothetical protein
VLRRISERDREARKQRVGSETYRLAARACAVLLSAPKRDGRSMQQCEVKRESARGVLDGGKKSKCSRSL